MQRLIFEPVCGSWVLETMTTNKTVIQDFDELTPAGVAMRFDKEEVIANLRQAIGDLEGLA